MNNWFIVKVRYTKQLDNGSFKRVSEPYLLSAMTFTDAEARIYEELGSIIRGEFHIVSITRAELHDIFVHDDADVFYKVTISYETEVGEEERKKKIKQTFLVSAHSVKDSYDRIKENLSTLLADYVITGSVESPIVEVFPPVVNLDREISRRPLEKTEPESCDGKPSIQEEPVTVGDGSGNDI